MINCKITLKLRLFCAIMGEIGEIGCFFEREVTRKGRDFKILSDTGEFVPIDQQRVGDETVLTLESIGAWQYRILIGSV